MAQLEALSAAGGEAQDEATVQELQLKQMAMEQRLQRIMFLRSELAAKALQMEQEQEA
jgi:hypothetical protein